MVANQALGTETMSKGTDINIDPSCEDIFDSTLMSVEGALEQIATMVSPSENYEVVPLRETLGRVLSRDIVSPTNVPNHNNSAMDGYAIRFDDLSRHYLTSVGTAWAGKRFEGIINPGECVRIMTGAVMPGNSDTVVMQEHTERNGDTVRVAQGQKRGQHVRYAGEDLGNGEVALLAGIRISPAELGIAASLGVSELPVYKKPTVAFFSNGDELRPITEQLGHGEVYDSNRHTLYGMLTQAGVELVDLGLVPDDPVRIKETFAEASKIADLVITSAGASVGEADYVHDILQELGKVRFWKIAMKPGRPLAVGQIGSAILFGLPGNPVSVMVTFYQFVLPALRRLSGEKNISGFRCSARVSDKLRKKPGRAEFQRGVLSLGRDGQLIVKTTGEQGSGILTSMSRANCFIVLPLESNGADVGDIVTVEPFASLL